MHNPIRTVEVGGSGELHTVQFGQRHGGRMGKSSRRNTKALADSRNNRGSAGQSPMGTKHSRTDGAAVCDWNCGGCVSPPIFFISDVTGFGVGLWPCSLRQDYLDLCTPEHTSGFFDPTVVSN